jgi:hypothetical protein
LHLTIYEILGMLTNLAHRGVAHATKRARGRHIEARHLLRGLSTYDFTVQYFYPAVRHHGGSCWRPRGIPEWCSRFRASFLIDDDLSNFAVNGSNLTLGTALNSDGFYDVKIDAVVSGVIVDSAEFNINVIRGVRPSAGPLLFLFKRSGLRNQREVRAGKGNQDALDRPELKSRPQSDRRTQKLRR